VNRSVLAGAAGALAARALLPRVLMLKFRCDVATLNAGDATSLLKSYADDAVLHFNPGDHRWSGDWVGKPAITRFMRNFTDAKVQGEILQLWTAGPPWALTMIVRFDDFADHGGERLYENRTVLVLRTRWGKVVEQEDYYLDTSRIERFDRALTERGIAATS
jgi:ketosteroid isomerase-like protein